MGHDDRTIEEVTEKLLEKMGFHDVIHVTSGPDTNPHHSFAIIRVVGGWIYVFYGGHSAFVPEKAQK